MMMLTMALMIKKENANHKNNDNYNKKMKSQNNGRVLSLYYVAIFRDTIFILYFLLFFHRNH